ncbi:TetR family transcriptional regulator C-terminal domain-containing protein [Solitalea koreensis]|uniref:Tetracyclin repressor-like C-terminal domain-containing protein n=1 Tax=Solitalea koreensis TaxID=543615 RepID=A0A521ALZ0_9SPHI|nr:TetR family transcriptional regulator C-terminal domain-containing protein [Solitalea koreensis]SMO35670.1 hypothetical protein SAMN06265350_101239 [Solitalea koreensis]
MNTKEKLENAYIDYVLSNNEQPKSVYIFTKSLKLKEDDFYTHYNSFEAIEKRIWQQLFTQTMDIIKSQETYAGYNAREKALSFFYSFVEVLKSRRSFIIYSLKHTERSISTPAVLQNVKEEFSKFSLEIINEGMDNNELSDRKYISDRYKDALWLQFSFILNFWIHDDSPDFEKTDEAIEKGINVTFDLMSRSPIDNLIEYGKFLVKNSKFKPDFIFK